MKKILYYSLLLCFMLMSLCTDTYAQQSPLRVAFLPQQEGFYFIEENGGFAGYNYDYLMEIAEYTGWDYEFVLIDDGWNSYNIAKEMLLN